MNSRIALRATLNSRWTSNQILSETGERYTLDLSRDFMSGSILNSIGEEVGVVEGGNGNSTKLLQAIKNFMITNLNCKFAVDNIVRDSEPVSVVLPAVVMNLSFSAVPTTGTWDVGDGVGFFRLSYDSVETSSIQLNPSLTDENLETALIAIPGLEETTVSGDVSTGFEITLPGGSDPDLFTVSRNNARLFSIVEINVNNADAGSYTIKSGVAGADGSPEITYNASAPLTEASFNNAVSSSLAISSGQINSSAQSSPVNRRVAVRGSINPNDIQAPFATVPEILNGTVNTLTELGNPVSADITTLQEYELITITLN